MKLRDLLEHYDFYYYDNTLTGELAENSRTVRIYMNESKHSNYFEIGASPCFWEPELTPSYFIKDEILERKVDHFNVEEDMQILFVYLQEEEECDEQVHRSK